MTSPIFTLVPIMRAAAVSNEGTPSSVSNRVILIPPGPDARAIRLGANPASSARSRPVYFGPDIGWVDAPIIGRSDLYEATWRQGPALIEEYDSTTVVPPNGRVRRIAWGTIELELG